MTFWRFDAMVSLNMLMNITIFVSTGMILIGIFHVWERPILKNMADFN